MSHTRKLLSCMVLGLALAACSGEDPDADVMNDGAAAKSDAATTPTSPAPAAPVNPEPEIIKPVTISNDAITIGKSVQDGHVVKAQRAQFSLADTVHAGVAGGHPAGAEARVYWTYQDGLSHKEETKPLTAEGAVFTFSRSEGMKPGRYSVQVDVGPTPIGLVDFEVK